MSERPPYRLPRDVVPEHYSLVFTPDLDRASFEGEAAVDVEVRTRVSEIVLNAAELEITEASLEAGGPGIGSDGKMLDATVTYRPEYEQAAIILPAPVEPGRWKLRLSFSGKLNDLLRGFYRSRWRAPDGSEAWIATTQFESTDARRAFPCWDEPD
ncbi:MAG TPA: hypothetical protein VED59_07560, partial [Acidimicrobiales bacterium]|nr:hypothetical protein [Acidimicrobiales bacterium]